MRGTGTAEDSTPSPEQRCLPVYTTAELHFRFTQNIDAKMQIRGKIPDFTFEHYNGFLYQVFASRISGNKSWQLTGTSSAHTHWERRARREPCLFMQLVTALDDNSTANHGTIRHRFLWDMANATNLCRNVLGCSAERLIDRSSYSLHEESCRALCPQSAISNSSQTALTFAPAFRVNLSRERGNIHGFLFPPRVLYGFPRGA